MIRRLLPIFVIFLGVTAIALPARSQYLFSKPKTHAAAPKNNIYVPQGGNHRKGAGISALEPQTPADLMKLAAARNAPQVAALKKMHTETLARLASTDDQQRFSAIKDQALQRQQLMTRYHLEREKAQAAQTSGGAGDESKPQPEVIYNRPGDEKPVKVFSHY